MLGLHNYMKSMRKKEVKIIDFDAYVEGKNQKGSTQQRKVDQEKKEELLDA